MALSKNSSVVSFINSVKDHPCLWNCSIPTYSKTDVTTAAWREIASKLHDSERNCRERWKNIRTAYVRSLKPPKPGESSKKTYYLSEYLAFLNPHLKVGDTFGNLCIEDSAEEQSSTNQDDGCEIFAEEEFPEECCSVQVIEKPSYNKTIETLKKRKKTDSVDDAFAEWIKKKVDKRDPDAEKHFLLSLLPEMRNLSNRRKRTFKIQTMSLLHKLLEEDERENVHSSISEASSPSTWSSSPYHGSVQPHNSRTGPE